MRLEGEPYSRHTDTGEDDHQVEEAVEDQDQAEGESIEEVTGTAQVDSDTPEVLELPSEGMEQRATSPTPRIAVESTRQHLKQMLESHKEEWQKKRRVEKQLELPAKRTRKAPQQRD